MNATPTIIRQGDTIVTLYLEEWYCCGVPEFHGSYLEPHFSGKIRAEEFILHQAVEVRTH